MFGVKDTIRCKLRTCVVYRVLCADCNACYVGETSQHLSTRVHEHLVSDKTSYIFGHLHNSLQCRTLCSDECFNILKSKKLSTFNGRNLLLIRDQLYRVNLKLSLQMHILFCYYCLLCPISILLRT